ncbi:predicted N-acetylglucosamine kinase [Alistipes sp. CAG:268]|jgi:glucosamine kinase|uniref:N-acetylglucosamine kinase n=1 Tax=Alistipes sp. CAG:268 TaxID=1262693 RepID=UPI0003379A9C|nr:N-acetylglucosamine kinase [Alistipes sp. CAG:268]CDC95938.1 predicted N-acetylglucosamine kinase [Alistipes sp. CAG:268]
MKAIADSGSTKCEWIFGDGDRILRLRTVGINAVQQSPDAIRAVLAELPPLDGVEELRFYGAGCGDSFPEASAVLRRELAARFGPGAAIGLGSDLLGAARALFGRGEGIACILGTGSNSCHCRGGEIVAHVPPLGYVLGDEGSGAVLGRNLVNGIFKGTIPLREEFLRTFALTYAGLIRRVYREPAANRFLASFAPFIRAHLDCAPVREMVVRSFGEFAARNLSGYPAGLPVAFVGGVAAHFEEPLREAMAAAGREVVRIVCSPAEEIWKYHGGESDYRAELGI